MGHSEAYFFLYYIYDIPVSLNSTIQLHVFADDTIAYWTMKFTINAKKM